MFPEEWPSIMLPHRMTRPRPASDAAVAKVGEKLIAALAGRDVNDLLNDLRLHAKSRKFLVPSASHPHHQYEVHRIGQEELLYLRGTQKALHAAMQARSRPKARARSLK